MAGSWISSAPADPYFWRSLSRFALSISAPCLTPVPHGGRNTTKGSSGRVDRARTCSVAQLSTNTAPQICPDWGATLGSLQHLIGGAHACRDGVDFSGHRSETDGSRRL